jgi:hypothetical protein
MSRKTFSRSKFELWLNSKKRLCEERNIKFNGRPIYQAVNCNKSKTRCGGKTFNQVEAKFGRGGKGKVFLFSNKIRN